MSYRHNLRVKGCDRTASAPTCDGESCVVRGCLGGEREYPALEVFSEHRLGCLLQCIASASYGQLEDSVEYLGLSDAGREEPTCRMACEPLGHAQVWLGAHEFG